MTNADSGSVGLKRLTEPRGRGSSGRVYREVHHETGSVRGVKVLREDLLDDPSVPDISVAATGRDRPTSTH